ncbi:MAG: trypsin-like peptidase domain-containing protein [Elusimicrobia bacterium]|nr:trypsin-like peptidase domain-containing protein [Elusimicrobiota bacterium]
MVRKALLCVLVLAGPACAQERVSTLFGADGRVEAHQSQDARLREMSRSVAAVFSARQVSMDLHSGWAHLRTSPFVRVQLEDFRIPPLPLSPRERFYGQPSGGRCTAFLVGPDLVATAGHCFLSPGQCRFTKFVFGFAVKKSGSAPSRIPLQDVYSCKTLLEWRGDLDFALARLDRPVVGRRSLMLSRRGEISEGTPLAMIGHPMGLPLKIEPSGVVSENSFSGSCFEAHLDSFPGNSGSPVINLASYEVEGLAVAVPGPHFAAGPAGAAQAVKLPESSLKTVKIVKMSRLLPVIDKAALKDRLKSRAPGKSLLNQPPRDPWEMKNAS